MIPLTPTVKAELVTIDDDIVRYRVYCDQCDDWHYHGPADGHRECHCSNNADSLYHATGYVLRCRSVIDTIEGGLG